MLSISLIKNSYYGVYLIYALIYATAAVKHNGMNLRM